MNLSRPATLLARITLGALLLAGSVHAASDETSARYRVTFDATWSNTTHPSAYPASAHFSPLVGATHDASVAFWTPGGLASPGMELMAETGGQSTLASEVNAAIAAGSARELLRDNLLMFSPTVNSRVTLTVSSDHPLVTLVTMIAPSPDWFVGVTGLPLFENGQWRDEVVVSLYAWDAGTDSGTGFNSPDLNTSPQEPIALITQGPFFGQVPLGTFTFRRLESTLVYGCGVNPPGSLLLQSGRPYVGTTMQVALTDPTGTMLTPAPTFLALSAGPDPAYPCGTSIPGWGLAGVGMPGEFLLANTQFIRVGAPYSGTPVPYSLPIPNDGALVGRDLYMQGLLIDPTKRRGLTEPLEIHVGMPG